MIPNFVGVAGGTGSGKTTVAQEIASALPQDKVSILEHDSYYRDLSTVGPEERAAVNFDHPASLETELLVAHITALKAGQAVEVPSYDFTTHARRAETRRVEPTPVVIVEGILVFADAALRAQLDIKIFVDTDADIRVFRCIRRDIEQRGRTFQSVRDQYYRTVRPMHLEFVEPSKRWADVVIPEGGENWIAVDLIVHRVRAIAEGKDVWRRR